MKYHNDSNLNWDFSVCTLWNDVINMITWRKIIVNMDAQKPSTFSRFNGNIVSHSLLNSTWGPEFINQIILYFDRVPFLKLYLGAWIINQIRYCFFLPLFYLIWKCLPRLDWYLIIMLKIAIMSIHAIQI